ncbi:MAG: cytochrome c3 family protein [Desulfobacteraceae bacterium]|nr:cytochrome c3 family protein [Desulfobacteraceae bacterium]
MGIRSALHKHFFIFFLSLMFMISACSTPSEDKKTTQTEPAKAETPAPAVTKPEPPAPEIPKPEEPKTPAPKPVPPAPEPENPKAPAPPDLPKPVTPKPVKESTLSDIITMKNPAYPEHKKGIVLFTHKKHIEDYEIGCGKCHHDKDGKPLNELKENDKVDNCISCHAKLGQAPRPKDKTKLSLKQKLEYHAEAIHENCIKCHKEYNKQNDTKAAPSSCTKCHPKRS